MAPPRRSRKKPRFPAAAYTDPLGFAALVARYLDWLQVHHFSPLTANSFETLLARFAAFCGERGIERPAEVTRELVERYQRLLYHHRRPNGRPLGFKTQHQHLVAIKGFFKWLARERYVIYNPAAEIILPRQPTRLPTDSFTVAEVEQVLAVPNVSTPLGLRDRAILETLYSTGIRRTELTQLDLYDLDLDRRWLRVRQGKGKKDRVVPIGERATLWVRRYLEEVRPQLVWRADEWAIFLSGTGQRFDAGSLTHHVRDLIEASGIRPRWGACHLFRHTCATVMLEGGADIRFIQEMLGHASLETTEIYTKVSIEKLQQIHAATHPARIERTSTVAREIALELEEEDDARG
ncbi:MAG: site-specific tyrosine recombinase XerC [Candidatus Binatia bacterium]